MNKTTWIGNVSADGKVHPAKAERTIDPAIVLAMRDKLTAEVEVTL